MDHLTQTLNGLVGKVPRSVLISLACFGALRMAIFVKDRARCIYRRYLAPSYSLPLRYGVNSWVIITGASTNAGMNWAEYFAKLNFNLILIDTNDSIQTLKLRLINKFGIKVESVTDEFTYQEKLSNLIDAQDLDVSVVVVNSMPIQIGIFKSILSEDGKIESGAFEDMDQENTFNLITSNLTSPTLLIGSLLPRLQKRKNRSAIILASSYFNMKFPFSAIHSAIQEYNRILAATLQEEIKGKVDVLSVFLSGKSVGWYLRYVGKRTSI